MDGDPLFLHLLCLVRDPDSFGGSDNKPHEHRLYEIVLIALALLLLCLHASPSLFFPFGLLVLTAPSPPFGDARVGARCVPMPLTSQARGYSFVGSIHKECYRTFEDFCQP